MIKRSNAKNVNSQALMNQIENSFNKIKEDQFLVDELEEVADQGSKTRSQDILDFIAYDWEERNKDLEQNLRQILKINKRLDQHHRGALTALARAIDA